MIIFVTVLTLAAIFSSSEAGPKGRIIGGETADEDQFGYFVGISQGENAVAHCGGAIIDNNWVVTAAQCVENLPNVTLHIGSHNYFSSDLIRITVPANLITMHPDYNSSTYYNDIALISTDIQFTHRINKVDLPSMQGIPDPAPEIVTTIGWGQDENGVFNQQNLKVINMTAMSHEDCQYFMEDGFNADKTLCALTDINGSICGGDAGGPAILNSNKILVGIVSFHMMPDCSPGFPIGLVRVTEYLDWIRSVSGVYR